MKRKRLYIAISILVIVLTVGLLVWAVFIGRQQQELQQDIKDLGYFGSTSGGGSQGGGLFGGVFGGGDEGDFETPGPEPILRQIYNLPTAGYIKKRADAIRFVDRATGHVFEKDLPDGTTTRIEQTTVPRVYNAVFTEDGDGVVRQYIDEKNNIISIYNEISGDPSEGFQLPINLIDIKSNGAGNQLVSIARTPEGSAVSLLHLDGSVEKNIFSSALRDWSLDWEGDSLLLTQKPSGNLPGSSYLFDVASGAQSTALQQVAGLTTKLNLGGDLVLYASIRGEGRPVLSVKNLKTRDVISLDVAGLPEKCVWDSLESNIVFCALPNSFPDVQLPDAWYQGGVHFVDALWKIDVSTGFAEHILSPTTSNGVSLDMTSLAMSRSGDAIFFINKTDQTLWSLTFPDRDIRANDSSETETNNDDQ